MIALCYSLMKMHMNQKEQNIDKNGDVKFYFQKKLIRMTQESHVARCAIGMDKNNLVCNRKLLRHHAL